jgi:hypothetical protein
MPPTILVELNTRGGRRSRRVLYSLGLHLGQGIPAPPQVQACRLPEACRMVFTYQPQSSHRAHFIDKPSALPSFGTVAFVPRRPSADSKCSITNNGNSHTSDRSERPLSVTIELSHNDGDQYAKANLHCDHCNRYWRGFYKWLLCSRKRIDIDGASDRPGDEHDRHEHRHHYYRNG